MLSLRTWTVALALTLCAAVIPAAPAHAQTDAALGCTYSIAPEAPGPVGHANRVRLTISSCTYEWDALEVLIGKGGLSTRTVAPAGYACDDGGNNVLCVRPVRGTGGAVLTIRPQCPRGGTLPLTLAVTDGAGVRRRGAVKQVACTPPPVTVLKPPARQSLATALSRGVLMRFSCRGQCTASAAVYVESGPGVGAKAGSVTLRRTRAGTYVARVRIKPSFRRRWRRQAGVWVSVTVSMRASTGEQVMLGHEVRLRR